MDFKNKESMKIILPIKESDYAIFVTAQVLACLVIEDFYGLHSELFPVGISSGYSLNGKDHISQKSKYQLH